ncbi:hypothetical protein ElyMa_000975800 [Elysia marginata]|uniref:Uncharacterized protein n=1 Tax=Elysia marginata TaxID=1093978 RepID=A0AAV4HGA4_9GAST|nr:hypothetical protein ElyMa_000975800 [Elysia marginata]
MDDKHTKDGYRQVAMLRKAPPPSPPTLSLTPTQDLSIMSEVVAAAHRRDRGQFSHHSSTRRASACLPRHSTCMADLTQASRCPCVSEQ